MKARLLCIMYWSLRRLALSVFGIEYLWHRTLWLFVYLVIKYYRLISGFHLCRQALGLALPPILSVALARPTSIRASHIHHGSFRNGFCHIPDDTTMIQNIIMPSNIGTRMFAIYSDSDQIKCSINNLQLQHLKYPIRAQKDNHLRSFVKIISKNTLFN